MAARSCAHPARVRSLRFWPAYATTMRPYLLFVSGITGIAGMSLGSSLSTTAVTVLASAFFLSYGFGQALTDCFQTDTDSLSSPYRPLVRGDIVARDVLVVSIVGLAACGVTITAFNPVNAIPAVAAVGGLATYTWFKRRWWGGPWYNAWIVSLLVPLGYLATGGGLSRPLGLVGTMAVAFFAYANFVLAGYFKDIEADRATGYATLPVVYGRRVGARTSDALALLALASAIPAIADAAAIVAGVLFIAPAIAWAVIAQWRLHRVRRDDEAHRAIGPVVHTYVLLLAGIAAAHHPPWTVWLVGVVAAYAWTMTHRPLAAQI